jgi:glycosyltransferase involved in cell wall biosynthesis
MVAPSKTSSEQPDLAIFIPSYAGGGAERVAIFLARTLTEAGLSVDFVVARSKGALRDEPLCGANRVHLGAPNEMLATTPWVRYLKRTRPRSAMSMIHSANLISGVGARFAPEVPLIVNLRIALDCHPSSQWWFRKRFGLAPERNLYQRAARVVGLSQGVANEASELLAIPKGRVIAIPNPYEARDEWNEIAPEHELIFKKPVVLGVGRLAPQKHFDMLLEAFERVSAERDLNLLILGQGPDREALLARASALGIADRVFLPGFVPNPQAYLRRARVFALSSRNEGFCMALVEALAAGAAIVSTDCPWGPAEVLEGGRYGRLTPVGDESAFASALAKELDAPDVGHEARRTDRAERLKEFDPPAITARYLQLVRDVIEQSAK